MKRYLAIAILILAAVPGWAATLYVKSTGNNTDGTTLAKAFTTITKSLAKTCGGGASNCSTGGDVIWVAPGTYNEVVTTGLDAPVSELQVKCDLTGVNTSSAPGMCIVTPYTGGLTAASSSSVTFTISKNYLTVDGFYFYPTYNSSQKTMVINSGVTNTTLRRCVIINHNSIGLGITAIAASATLIDRCIVYRPYVTLTKSATGDYDSGVKFLNCVIPLGIASEPAGADTYKGGGILVENCFVRGNYDQAPFAPANADLSSTYPVWQISSSTIENDAYSYGNMTNNSGQIMEDWNVWKMRLANITPTDTLGANSKGPDVCPILYDMGASMLMGLQPRFPWSPLAASPITGLNSYSMITKVPGTVATSNATGTVNWTNPNNVKQRDAVLAETASLAAAAESYWLKCTNFGFAIPAGSAIKAVVVSMGKHANNASSIKDIHVQLIDDSGTLAGLDQPNATFWAATTNTFANGVYGNSATVANQLWTPGITLTPAIVNDADFGVAISVKNNHGATAAIAYIDVIRITVYYTSQTTTDILGIARPATVTPGPSESKQFQRGGNSGHAQ